MARRKLKGAGAVLGECFRCGDESGDLVFCPFCLEENRANSPKFDPEELARMSERARLGTMANFLNGFDTERDLRPE